jgi:Uri superfamily endonuclease
MQKCGTYLLHLDVKQPAKLYVGSLRRICLPPGRYIYVGSARRNMAGRISRHQRLAAQKTGKLHWHIDYVLTHPQVRLMSVTILAGRDECDISRRIAAHKGASTPILNFGSTDCRAGCKAHLYLLNGRKALFSPRPIKQNARYESRTTYDHSWEIKTRKENQNG